MALPWRTLCGLTAAAALGAAAWWLAQEVVPASRPLSDGATLVLEGVTFGREHVYRRQRRFQQLLLPVLPEGLRPAEIGRFETPEPALGFFLTRQSGPPIDHVELLDAHGCAFGRAVQRTESPGPGQAGKTFFAVPERGGLPRRAGRLHLRVFPSAGAPPVEFTPWNPLGSAYPTWPPQPVPALAADQGLSISLVRVAGAVSWKELERLPSPSLARVMHLYGRLADWRRRSAQPLPAPEATTWTRLDFTVTRAGRRITAWRPESVTFSDATGNAVTFSGADGGLRSGLLREVDPVSGVFAVALPTPLCTLEPAWKVRTEFAYTGSDQNFGYADLRWTVPNVPVPAKETTLPAGFSTSQSGFSLRLTDLAGVDAVFPDLPDFPMERPSLRVQVNGPPGRSLQLGLRARDERGADVPCPFRGGPAPGEPQGAWIWGLKPEDAAARVNLSFAGWVSRSGEFVIAPNGAPGYFGGSSGK